MSGCGLLCLDYFQHAALAGFHTTMMRTPRPQAAQRANAIPAQGNALGFCRQKREALKGRPNTRRRLPPIVCPFVDAGSIHSAMPWIAPSGLYHVVGANPGRRSFLAFPGLVWGWPVGPPENSRRPISRHLSTIASLRSPCGQPAVGYLRFTPVPPLHHSTIASLRSPCGQPSAGYLRFAPVPPLHLSTSPPLHLSTASPPHRNPPTQFPRMRGAEALD